MNKKLSVILFAVIAIITVLLVTSCDGTPYEEYEDKGYTVSVKYDANGGTFTAGTSVIVDTYGLSTLPTKDGKKIAKLVTPDDEIRGAGNSFVPSKNGYTFVGWYATCQEKTDANGNVTYTYGDMWDFDKGLEIDPNKEYTASEPILTLYAAWIPRFSFEFYSLSDPNTLLKEYVVAPYTEIDIPKWDPKSTDGSIKMYQFPKIDGKTFEAVYLDPQGTTKLTGDVIKHAGTINYADATAKDPVMKLYIDTIDGEWCHIFNSTQLKNISPSGNYIIENDIDLEGKSGWPSFMVSGKFTGKLIGKVQENGEAVKLKNITFKQATGAAVYSTGLFGQISDSAVIENIAFENVTMRIDKGSPMVSNVNFGLLAGTIADGASLNGVSISGSIILEFALSKSSVKLPFKEGYSIGLVCGAGNSQGIDYSKITCVTTENNKEMLAVTVTEDKIELELIKAE